MVTGARETDGGTLMAFGPSPSEEGVANLTRIRGLTKAEAEAARRAGELLQGITTDSPYADLTHATWDLQEQHDNLIRHAFDPGPMPVAVRIRQIQGHFKRWLSAFRSFDDRNSAWVSREFGKEHPSYLALKAALSAEFDGNFAYRLCSGLRNVAEHSGDAINYTRFQTAIDPSVDRTEVRLGQAELGPEDWNQTARVGFNGPELARRYTQIRSATRRELAEMTAPASLQAVVSAAFISCVRVHSALFVGLWPDLVGAVELLEGLQGEAEAVGGQVALLVDSDLPSDPDHGPFQLGSHPVPIGYAHLARQNLDECRQTLAQPEPRYRWQDLLFE